MRTRAPLSAVVLALAIGAWASRAGAQALVPLGDSVENPLLPAGINNADVEMFGELVHLWKDADGSDVVHYIGDFELQLGARRLNAREAVVWVSPRKYQQIDYHRFEVALWRDARVVDSAGSITRGPALFVSFNASGKIRVSSDQRSDEASADTTVFQRAARVRAALKDRIPDMPDAPVTVVDLARAAGKPQYEVRPPISYQGRELTVQQIDGRSVVTAIGNVYVFRGEAGGSEALELRADAAVVYLSPEATAPKAGESGKEAAPLDDRPGRATPGQPSGAVGPSEGGALSESLSAGPTFEGAGQVEAVYLEGDIVLASGERTIRASRLYYDFTKDRALILDAVARFFEPQRGLPVVLRANEVRQLSAREFEATSAKFTTSEFATPHYHLGAEDLSLVDNSATPQVAGPAPEGLRGTFVAEKTTFNIGGVPILYWPYVRGDVSETETSLKKVRFGYSDDFGAEFESRWALFNILGLEKPPGFDGTFLLDYYSERGPAVGADLDYETDHSFGLVRSYLIHDDGRDDLGRFRDEMPDTDTRGRLLWRHREFLPDDWQISFELAYLSDKNFLEEYFEPEFDRGKEQESLIYIKKQVDNWAFVTHLQYRLHEWLQTTERLPDTSFHLIGESLGDTFTAFSESHLGFDRYRTPDRGLQENLLMGGVQPSSGTVGRADTREEAEVPLRLGDVKIVPFGGVRGTTWDDAPASGNLSRAFGSYGVRASSYAWKVYPDVHDDLLDVNGIRHIVKLDAVGWGSHTNVDGDKQFLFDENIEGIDEVDGGSVGLRQRFQTKRGAPGKERNVDLFTFDLEAGFFNDAERDEYTYGFTSPTRPENSVSRNYVNAAGQYRVNDTTDLLGELNYDVNDGEVDVFDITYAVQRTPRLSYLLGFRYIEEINSNLLGFGVNYKVNEKYTMAVREEFDLERGQTSQFLIGVSRKFPRWYVGMNFDLDETEDDFGISLSAWPEGLPSAALGSRRFTGLTDSVGIRPGS